ncbi:MAG: rRNA adenine N-6-methyltransferase family protein, partial [Kineosporiaceae bacterium]
MSDVVLPLLSAREIRRLAEDLDVRPTKVLGQNFVVDANTVRRIVRASAVDAGDVVLEVGPGLGSLTLALLDVAGSVTAVEIDPVLAQALPATVARQRPGAESRLRVVRADAVRLDPGALPGPAP